MQKLRYTAPGSAPATLVPLPEQAGCKPKLQLIEYDAHSFQEREIELTNLESLHSSRVNWINVGGLGDVETLRKIGDHVGCSRRHDPVLQAKELVVIAHNCTEDRKDGFLNRRSQR